MERGVSMSFAEAPIRVALTFGVAFPLAIALFPSQLFAAEPKRPNILLIMADDQRGDTISALGNPEIHTPHLDQLAQRGFHFTNAYCMGSMTPAVCLPSRSMLLT